MKAAAFQYRRAATLADVFEAFEEHGDMAQILAGGQSLLPSLGLRLSSPDMLIDINHVPGLSGVELREDHVRIGALTRYADILASPIVRTHVPLLAQAIPYVAHMAIRNRGTIGGSLVLADPAAEMPACAIALDAVIALQSRAGRREVPAPEFFRGLYDTDRQADEILTEILFPAATAADRFGFGELSMRHGDFAIVGIAAKARVSGTIIDRLKLVLFGSEPTPLSCATAAQIAVGRPWSEQLGLELADALQAEMQPSNNLSGSAETKKRQAGALAKRVLKEMFEGNDHG